MKKTTKGALAAGTAAVLLMGGAGTLAYWTDSATVAGTGVTTGHLKLINADCGDGWLVDAGTPDEFPLVGATRLVPGDTFSQTCTYDVDAVGDHILAEVTIDEGTGFTGNADLLEELDLSSSSIEVNNVAYAGGAVAVSDGQTIEVTFVAAWPFNDQVDDPAQGAGAIDNGANVSGGVTAALAAVGVTLTQVDFH
ncbi:alternate-type signal peptide domain-containing protein [Nocardioides sp. LHD-245]|uniref:alternate-type signal peptide domain-containing protein n=1 Tax=Nocardioides sp. LHD-245 TaxID=3051387 RepID=UPI0027DF8C97|nr:alternate-type signal peptide domain-containing protein [Nocardioides sp. LHD-245]